MNIIDFRHPCYTSGQYDAEKYRLTYAADEAFRERYLEKYSQREDDADFRARKNITPIPGFVSAALNDIRNAIFQRLRDVTRTGGSNSYQAAVQGLDGGIDRRGSTMNSFLGVKALTDLLVMGRTGVFVDSPQLRSEPTLGEAVGIKPYVYAYQLEDILSWSYLSADQPSEFKSVLLRDTVMEYDESNLLPTRTIQRYRRLWMEGGRVSVQYYNEENAELGGPKRLELTRIPFVLLDLGASLIRGVCDHQIALLNLGSSDVSYALQSNFPFYVRQVDPKATGQHLKHSANTGTATTGGQGASDRDERVGVTRGQSYGPLMNQPAFINPSSEPLQASMQLQSNLKDDIRSLVNLAVQTLATRDSAESKQLDNQGLEAGLSYIGLMLENAERKIAEFWAAYEEKNESKRQIPTIHYPDRYSLKTDEDRIKEASELSDLMHKVPGQTVKREIAKTIVDSLLGGRVSVGTIEKINTEINETPYTTSDPDTIISAVEKGLCSEETGSLALGFGPDEYKQARKDHAERVARIAEAQGVKSDPAARGVLDLSADPDAGKKEKEAALALEEKNQRGKGK